MARHIAPPVRRTEIWAACDDDGAQALIADQAQIRRVADRTCFRASFVVVTMTGDTVGHVYRFPLLWISGHRVGIRRRGYATKRRGVPPMFTDAANDGVDLFIGQHSALLARKSGHGGAGPAIGDRRPKSVVVDDR